MIDLCGIHIHVSHLFCNLKLDCVTSVFRHMEVRIHISVYADRSRLLLHAGGHEEASTGSGDSGVERESHSESSEAPQNVFVPGEGVVTEADDRIILRDVPIVTPNLDVVVSKLSLEVK